MMHPSIHDSRQARRPHSRLRADWGRPTRRASGPVGFPYWFGKVVPIGNDNERSPRFTKYYNLFLSTTAGSIGLTHRLKSTSPGIQDILTLVGGVKLCTRRWSCENVLTREKKKNSKPSFIVARFDLSFSHRFDIDEGGPSLSWHRVSSSRDWTQLAISLCPSLPSIIEILVELREIFHCIVAKSWRHTRN